MSGKTFAKVGLAALFAVSAAFAQVTIKAEIPFDFSAAGTRMTAGQYLVKFDANGILRLVRDDRKASCLVTTTPVHGKATPQAGKLVFNRYGDTFYLSQVWHPGYDRGRQLSKSRAEIEVARNATAAQRASVSAVQEQPSERAAGREGQR